jgi:hypothetical protein
MIGMKDSIIDLVYKNIISNEVAQEVLASFGKI